MPALDHNAKAVRFDEELLCLLGQVGAEMEQSLHYGPLDFPSEDCPFMAGVLGGQGMEPSAFSLLTQEIEPAVLPIPNGQGGVTASIDLYAGIRANSPYGELAGKILSRLVAPEALVFEEPGTLQYLYSVNRDAVRPLLDDYFSVKCRLVELPELDCTGLADQLAAAAEQINTARFSGAGNEALEFDVLAYLSTGRATLEEAAGDFAKKYRFYFDE